jgi:hypothetical protein
LVSIHGTNIPGHNPNQVTVQKGHVTDLDVTVGPHAIRGQLAWDVGPGAQIRLVDAFFGSAGQYSFHCTGSMIVGPG